MVSLAQVHVSTYTVVYIYAKGNGTFSYLIREPGPPTSLHNTMNMNDISKWPQHITPTLTIVVTGL